MKWEIKSKSQQGHDITMTVEDGVVQFEGAVGVEELDQLITDYIVPMTEALKHKIRNV